MSLSIREFVISILPGKKKQNQAGWISFNAVCCPHNGESQDTRGRAGIIASPDGKISYSCFNCKFKTSYIPGRALTYKFRKLLSWLGVDTLEIKRLSIVAWQIKETIDPNTILPVEDEIKFEARQLPKEALNFFAWVEFYELAERPYDKGLVDSVQYIYDRKISLQKYEFYWSPEVEHKLSHRVIIPFKYRNEIVGYTARALNSGIVPKYHSNHPAGFVFNLDNQKNDSKFVIVCEGAFDAMSIDGVSTQTNDISEQQANLIDELAREVIVVPDFDLHINKNVKKVWPGEQMINKAIEYGWSVSFPDWRENCKDINDSVVKYGKLFTLYNILQTKESNSLKISLLAKKYKQTI